MQSLYLVFLVVLTLHIACRSPRGVDAPRDAISATRDSDDGLRLTGDEFKELQELKTLLTRQSLSPTDKTRLEKLKISVKKNKDTILQYTINGRKGEVSQFLASLDLEKKPQTQPKMFEDLNRPWFDFSQYLTDLSTEARYSGKAEGAFYEDLAVIAKSTSTQAKQTLFGHLVNNGGTPENLQKKYENKWKEAQNKYALESTKAQETEFKTHIATRVLGKDFSIRTGISPELKSFLPAYLEGLNDDAKKLAFKTWELIPIGEKSPDRVLKEFLQVDGIFGPTAIKTLQQEATYVATMRSRGIDVDDDLEKVFDAAKERPLLDQEKLIEKVRKELGDVTFNGKKVKVVKVMSAASIGVTFLVTLEGGDGKSRILKWVPEENVSRLEREIETLKEQAKTDPERRVDLEKAEGYLPETDLSEEAKNSEKLRAIYESESKSNIKVIPAQAADGVNSGTPKNDKLRRFNLQEVAPGESLYKLLQDGNLQDWQLKQLARSLGDILEVHLDAITDGKPFHNDFHQGNLFVEFQAQGGDDSRALLSVIDTGSIDELGREERVALAYFYEHAKDIKTDLESIKQNSIAFETLVQKHDSRFKQLTQTGGDYSLDNSQKANYIAFLEMITGEGLPSDRPLRALRLKPGVVSSLYSISTVAGVINEFNKRGMAFSAKVSSGRLETIKFRTAADFHKAMVKSLIQEPHMKKSKLKSGNAMSTAIITLGVIGLGALGYGTYKMLEEKEEREKPKEKDPYK